MPLIVAASIATIILGCTLAFATTAAAGPDRRSNHCFDFDGSDLNEVYDTNDAFVTPYCSDAFVGSRWRPLARWHTATTYEVKPPDYEPLGATPALDFLAKLESTRYVVDAGTADERSIEVDADRLLIDTSTLDASLEVTNFTPRLRTLPLGRHTVDVYLTMSAEHWDGLGLDEENRLPAGEVFLHTADVDVVAPRAEPEAPPPPVNPDLRLELEWDTEADLDLHLLHPNGDWSTAPWDCYWANRNPNWGRLDSQRDDPLLEIDDTDGFGPEVITLSNLERVTYKVGVLHFSGPPDTPTTATIRVWAGGELVSEMSTELPGPRHFWTVAAIDLHGHDITVTPIDEVTPL